MSSSGKVLLAALTSLILSFCLPSPGGEWWFPVIPAFQNEVLAATPTTAPENEEEPEPFAEAAREEYAPDPLERLNRGIFYFNDKVYFWFLKPASQIYGVFIPPGLRTCIRNGFDNLKFPIRFVNNVLQGKFKAAGIETGRFLINSTVGFAGFFEIAAPGFLSASSRRRGDRSNPGILWNEALSVPCLAHSRALDASGLVGPRRGCLP